VVLAQVSEIFDVSAAVFFRFSLCWDTTRPLWLIGFRRFKPTKCPHSQKANVEEKLVHCHTTTGADWLSVMTQKNGMLKETATSLILLLLLVLCYSPSFPLSLLSFFFHLFVFSLSLFFICLFFLIFFSFFCSHFVALLFLETLSSASCGCIDMLTLCPCLVYVFICCADNKDLGTLPVMGDCRNHRTIEWKRPSELFLTF
jgi:hypothetical protein